jgi:MFS family permease
MITTGIVAIDSTILATAVPTIVGDLGGFAEFPWLFSVYFLAQAVSVPVYAKLSDVVGRKTIILVGIGLFLLGSILCAVAWNMPALIAFRVVQGLGAGAVLPMAITIAGDIYTIKERAKVQGYLASVWAIAAVVGPTLGGVFAQFAICVVATWMLLRTFHETVEHRTHKVDYLGATLLVASLTLLILAILEGGQAWAWDSPISIAAFSIGGLLLAGFVIAERFAAEPILPLWVFSRPLLLTTTLVGLGIGSLVIGLTSYVPTYLEGTLHVTPLAAGLALAALTLGWPLSATFAGRIYLRIGFRNTAIIGMAVVVLAAAALAAVAMTPNIIAVAVLCFIMGMGFGISAVPTLIAAQASVPWGERGVVTGTNMFARSIGSAVGIAIFGAVANAIFAGFARGERDPTAVATASSAVFLAVAIASVLTTAAVIAMPRTPVPAATGEIPVVD